MLLTWFQQLRKTFNRYIQSLYTFSEEDTEIEYTFLDQRMRLERGFRLKLNVP